MDVALKENLFRTAVPGMRRSLRRLDRTGSCGRRRAGLEHEQNRVIQTPDRRVFNDFARPSFRTGLAKNAGGDRDADGAFVLGLRGAFGI